MLTLMPVTSRSASGKQLDRELSPERVAAIERSLLSLWFFKMIQAFTDLNWSFNFKKFGLESKRSVARAMYNVDFTRSRDSE